jgi:type I restriction enzyme S subunit
MELKPGYKQTEVGVIPEEWDCVHIGDVAETSSGATPPRAKQQEYFDGGTIPWVKTLDLNNSSILETDECVTPSALQQTSLRVYPSGSVLVAMYGGFNQIGRTGMLTKDATINQALTAIRPTRSRLSSRFLLNYLNYRVEYWKSVASSSRKDPNITGRDVRGFPIPLPPLKEQEAVGEALQDVEDQISILEELITKKRNIKQATMQELLTGKRRLPGFEREWEVKRLGEIGSTFGGLTGKTKLDFGNGVSRYVTFMNVMMNVEVDCECFERVRIAPNESQNRVLRGDLLFNGSSETPEEVAMCSLLTKDVSDLYLNSFCFGFRLLADARVSGLFLTYLIRSHAGREVIKCLAQGSTRYNLSKSALLDAAIQLPALAEQNAIASVLSDLDAELTALEARKAKAQMVKQGMMQQLLTGKIRVK